MKILICDDHALVRGGLAQVLAELEDELDLLHAETGGAALEHAVENPDLDLALIDLQLPDIDGIQLLKKLRRRVPSTPVVMISATEEPTLVRAALDGGAAGFIPKSSKSRVLLSAVRLVLEGGVYIPQQALEASPGNTPAPPSEKPGRRAERKPSPLTPRQREVALLIMRGLTNREICNVLGLSMGTVKAHVAAMLEALDVTNRTEAVMALRELGLDEEADAP